MPSYGGMSPTPVNPNIGFWFVLFISESVVLLTASRSTFMFPTDHAVSVSLEITGLLEDPRKFPKSYFYNPDKIFEIWPEVYDNPDNNRKF